ncbi:MAG: addiction module protein [Gammaproteobacteria bacterium]|nr:addiction module protein [Gammaproteobacteria bacterium]
MAVSSESLLRDALELSAGERAVLVDELLESLGKPDPKIEAQWLKEAEERLAAYRRGKLEAYDVDEVFAELGKSD